MSHPTFYDQAPRIRMHDPLAALLGASDDGLLEYSYLDAVRLAGHSCPTVAGAFLVARSATIALFPDGPAIRGEIEVRMPAPEAEGTNGVIAQVLTLVTGAAAANGFHGIGGHFVRQHLLRFSDVSHASAIGFRRRDNAAAVSVELDLRSIPAPPSRCLPSSIIRSWRAGGAIGSRSTTGLPAHGSLARSATPSGSIAKASIASTGP